jgi:hypothetical protein
MISEFVEYVKQVWKNKPNVSSPLNADRLNHMEDGIENNSKKIKETVTAVNELTKNMVPSYNSLSTLYHSNSDITEQVTTIDKSGWVQCIAKTDSTSGTPFIRLLINNVIVYEKYGIIKNYSYAWSPLFRVKTGDIIKYTLTTETSDGLKELRFYLPMRELQSDENIDQLQHY